MNIYIYLNVTKYFSAVTSSWLWSNALSCQCWLPLPLSQTLLHLLKLYAAKSHLYIDVLSLQYQKQSWRVLKRNITVFFCFFYALVSRRDFFPEGEKYNSAPVYSMTTLSIIEEKRTFKRSHHLCTTLQKIYFTRKALAHCSVFALS